MKHIELAYYYGGYSSPSGYEYKWNVGDDVEASLWFLSLPHAEQKKLCSGCRAVQIKVYEPKYGYDEVCSTYLVKCSDYR